MTAGEDPPVDVNPDAGEDPPVDVNPDAGEDPPFDFHSDTPLDKDPDSFSPKLREMHRLLWSKELPSGSRFDLAMEPGSYLVHRSGLGVFFLASDTITTRLRKRASGVLREIPDDELPGYSGYTIGSSLVFPGNVIGGKQTINGARGFRTRIADRFDLTLECIRRHYLGGQPSPLADVLLRYADFFALFEDFEGYVDFFLLQDLVEDDGRTIRFFHPFADFNTPAVPGNRDDYLEYLEKSNAFIHARNRRISDYLGGDPDGQPAPNPSPPSSPDGPAGVSANQAAEPHA